MALAERFKECCRFIKNKMLWVILIPAFMDIANLISYEKIHHKVYIPVEQIITIKIGITSVPPSINYLLQDFPSVLFNYGINGLSGIITRVTLYNTALVITIAAEDGSIFQNLKFGISFLFNNFGITIKMAFLVGLVIFIFSFVSFFVLRIGTPGIIIDIVIFSFLGVAVNRMVYEVYIEGKSNE